MRLLSGYIAFLLVGLLTATTRSQDNGKVVITKRIYNKDLLKYKGKHDIVSILVPMNSLNFDESSSSELNETLSDIILFFVEADIQPDGSRVDRGLYVLKEGKAKKLLQHGRDAAATTEDSKLVFFGAKDGLYVYNQYTNSADKYGSLTDSIIGIAKTEGFIYILTEDREVYKVMNNGETKEKIEDIVNAQQIVLDYSNNIYFYTADKVPYVFTSTGVKKIEGLPKRYSSVRLIKPPYFLEDRVPALVDNKVYILYASGTSEQHGITFKPKAMPTAYDPELAFLQYYAYNKKIYEHNIVELITSSAVDELKNYLIEKAINDETPVHTSLSDTPVLALLNI